MEQSAQKVPIHAYLSYRCKNERDIDARNRLETVCKQHGITLKFDQNTTKVGDRIDEFMEDLTAARCVFLFLSPEYFQSAYTLYELIRIQEWADLDKRLIFPIRLTDSMVEKFRTQAKSYWLSKQAQADRDLLGDKLKQSDSDELWQRIDSAWEAIVKPDLGKLHPSMQSGNSDVVFGTLVSDTEAAVAEVIKESTKDLHETQIQNIAKILNKKTVNIDGLREELAMTGNNDTKAVANGLVKTKVTEAIAMLTRVIEEQKISLDTKGWKYCIHDAVQLSGWLLINSVDPIWWFHQEIKLKKTAETRISGNYPLDDPNYIEVVISRSLLQSAHYTLDKNNQPKPASKKYDVLRLFDAQSSDAKKETLLTQIYNDLYGIEPSSDIDLLAKITSRVKTHYRNEKGKLIYYLVSQDFLKTLESADWYEDWEKQLAGYLQFICCDQPTSSHERQASTEDQSDLLDQVAYLISLQD